MNFIRISHGNFKNVGEGTRLLLSYSIESCILRNRVAGHNEILPDLIEELFKDGTIDTFSTEAVLATNQAVLDDYLMDPLAAPESRFERLYFRILGEDFDWFSDPSIKELFRRLRILKLKYGDSVKVCGVDADLAERGHRRQTEMIVRFSEMSKTVQNQLEIVSRKNITEIIANERPYDREILMAQAAVNCFSKRSKMLVHVGAAHALSTRKLSGSKNWSEDWWSMSEWQDFFSSDDREPRILSAIMATAYVPGSEYSIDDLDYLLRAFLEGYWYFQPYNYQMVSRENIPEGLQNKFQTDQGKNISLVWDYWIFGPLSNEN